MENHHEENTSGNQKQDRINTHDNEIEKILAQSKAKKLKDNSGVLYMSQIPKGLTPSELRSMLSPFGDLGRVYMEPIDRSNQKKGFKEAWIEFINKKDAKKASLLNTMPMTFSRKYKDCLWNLRYLKSFNWSDLTSQMTFENAVKEQRERMSRIMAKKEAADYLERVEKNHTRSKIEEKRAVKRHFTESSVDTKEMEELRKKFKQRKPFFRTE